MFNLLGFSFFKSAKVMVLILLSCIYWRTRFNVAGPNCPSTLILFSCPTESTSFRNFCIILTSSFTVPDWDSCRFKLYFAVLGVVVLLVAAGGRDCGDGVDGDGLLGSSCIAKSGKASTPSGV